MSKDLGSKPDGYPVNRDLLAAIAQAHEDGAVGLVSHIGPPPGVSQAEWDATPIDRKVTISRANVAQTQPNQEGG